MKSIVSLSCLAVVAVWMSACGPSGNKGPQFSCEQLPTAPACQDVSTGDTTVTTNPTGDVSGDTQPEDTSCTPDCTGKVCGTNGCGGFCGECATAGTHCSAGQCIEGECGVGGTTATGELKVGQGITFDKASVTMIHKMDVDAFEDGCITSLVIELGRGFGCTLHVEANTATAPGGGLRITQMSFAADSQCPGFPDESEGQYTDFSQMKVLAVVPGIDKVPDANAPASCVTTNFDVKLEGTLVEPGTQKTLNVASTTIRVSGEVNSTGSTTASCPCAASCSGKECGDDGCGYSCGLCADNEECDGGGQCQCIPDCGGKECGDNGCGGSCGSCGQFETCENGGCVECEPTCAPTAECGDDGCGGNCGECDTNENCSVQSLCTCPGPVCGSGCCKAGDKCNGSACCTPQCNGKECGNDGCGGTCGTCSGNETCQANGQCSCTPSCQGKECGDNGCGGSCGSCGGGESCLPEGICATQTGDCDQNGFGEILTGGAALQSDGSFERLLVQGNTAASGIFDRIQFEIWRQVGGAWPVDSGDNNYTIPPNENYSTCVICVLLRDGCSTADCSSAKSYLLTEGILVLTDFTGVSGSEFGIGVAQATFEEVTIDANSVSTPVPNGLGWCIEDVVGLGVQIQ